jgi:DNA-binding MarR family transcriptional regulator
MAAMNEERDMEQPRSLVAGDFPYQSKLLANLSALILLWNSPARQGQILAKSGESLDQPSHQTLRLLLAWGAMRPTSLADELGVGASYVSKIVRRLESDGLVQRSTDPSDRRATLIRLTETGVEAARDVYALGDRMIAEVLDDWSPSDVRRYTDLTERFVSDAMRSAVKMRERGLRPTE